MNKVLELGRLTRDPQIYHGDKITSARFSMAVQREVKDKSGNYGADFPNFIAFGKTAEIVEKYLHKGSQVAIVGRIQTGSYTNKNGDKVYTTDIVVEKLEFVGSKADNAADAKPETKDEVGFMNVPETVEEIGGAPWEV